MTLPRVQPIAPTWRKDPFDHPEWVFGVKYDGFRAVAYIEQRRSRLISRNNNIMTRFNVLAEQVAATTAISASVDVNDQTFPTCSSEGYHNEGQNFSRRFFRAVTLTGAESGILVPDFDGGSHTRWCYIFELELARYGRSP